MYKKYEFNDSVEIVFAFKNLNNDYCLYTIDTKNRFAVKRENYYSTGSGSMFANFIMKRYGDYTLSSIDAQLIVGFIISEICTIDLFSNKPVNISRLSYDGIKTLDTKTIETLSRGVSVIDSRTSEFFVKIIKNPANATITEGGIVLNEGKK